MTLDVNKLTQRYEALCTARKGWDTAWMSLAELFLPCRWRADTDTTAHQSPQLNGRLVNSAGVLAMRTLAAGMQGGMTSPVRPWFRLTIKGDNDTKGMPGLNSWLEEVTSRMQRVLQESTFYTAVHGLYGDLGTFGTGLLIETADADGLHFHLIRAGEYVLDMNGRNEVDTFFRRIHMTARQIIDRWGEDVVPTAVKMAADQMTGQGGVTRFNVIHGVFPRKDFVPGRLGKDAKPFCSVYWLYDAGTGSKPALLSEGGYDSFPAYAPRWDVNGTDVYGRAPSMDVSPDCKMLQAMTATLRMMQHKIADPPLMADAKLRSFNVNTMPGVMNFIDFGSMTSAAPIVPLQQPDAQSLTASMQALQEVEKRVTEGLYTDLFRMLIDDDRRQITATEIQAKQQEKMILLGPVVERLHKELLEPLIIRTYMLMGQYGALPPMPDGLDDYAELDVSFESVLAQAQKLTATSAIDQGLAFVVGLAQAAPDAVDMLDTDQMVKTYLDRVGMPEGCIRDDQTIQQIRAQKAQAQAQAQQAAEQQAAMQQAVDMTAAAKNLGQTPVGADGQTLMGTILGGLGTV